MCVCVWVSVCVCVCVCVCVYVQEREKCGATRGVVVSRSAFLASTCHQCKSAGSNLGWDLNFWALACGILSSMLLGVFSGYSGFLFSFISGSAKKIRLRISVI